MAVYQPTYRDVKTGEVKQQRVWWYHFTFAGRRIRESSKSTRKTIAIDAEKKRHLELERGFNNIEDTRHERIRSIADVADEFLEAYKVRHSKSSIFAKYAISHVKRLLGKSMSVDVNDAAVKDYQTARLNEKASPKSVNEEVGFLLRILGDQGDIIRGKLRRARALKLPPGHRTARAFSVEEKSALLDAAKTLRSPNIYPALMLALHAGMRDAEIRALQWARVDLARAVVTVGAAKSEAGEGRMIPLNADVHGALVQHAKWYLHKFGETRMEWHVFPFGQPQPTDPTRHVTSFKTAWTKAKKAAEVTGRWHDNRHTFITDLAESGEASDETIRDIAGHVSKQMLKHYSHIRMEAKRRAVDSLVKKPTLTSELTPTSNEAVKEVAKVEQVN